MRVGVRVGVGVRARERVRSLDSQLGVLENPTCRDLSVTVLYCTVLYNI